LDEVAGGVILAASGAAELIRGGGDPAAVLVGRRHGEAAGLDPAGDQPVGVVGRAADLGVGVRRLEKQAARAVHPLRGPAVGVGGAGGVAVGVVAGVGRHPLAVE